MKSNFAKTNVKHTERRKARRGMGVIFIFVIGILVVMTIFMLTQFMTGQSATAEIEASDLGNRAGIIAESAAEECSYYTLIKSNDSQNSDATEIYKKIRTFEKQSSTEPSIAGPTGKGLKYLWKTDYSVPMNQGFYQSDSESDNVSIGKFSIGPLKQEIFPEGPKLGNESSGILGIEGEVTVNSKSGGGSIVRQVQFARDFRVLLLHPPYPFNNYTLFLKRKSSAIQDRFDSYFRAFESSETPLVPEFPIGDMSSDSRPVITTASELKPEYFVIKAFDDQSQTNIANLTTEQTAQLSTDIANVKAADFKKLDPEKSFEYVRDNYYNQMDWASFKNKASHYYPDFGRFVYDNVKEGNIELNGLYYIEKGVALDHSYSGRGIIVTTGTEDLVIRSLTRTSPESRLCVITINSNFDIPEKTPGTRTLVEADIMAPNGTINKPETAHIKGSVYLSHINPGSTSGPWIELPDDTATTPWTEGDDLDESYSKKLAVILSPGYSWKRSWNQRQ
jgi:hypothetical protein